MHTSSTSKRREAKTMKGPTRLAHLGSSSVTTKQQVHEKKGQQENQSTTTKTTNPHFWRDSPNDIYRQEGGRLFSADRHASLVEAVLELSLGPAFFSALLFVCVVVVVAPFPSILPWRWIWTFVDGGSLLRPAFRFRLCFLCSRCAVGGPPLDPHDCRQKNPSFLPHRSHVNVNSAQVCVVSGSHTFRRFCGFSWDTFHSGASMQQKINGTICFFSLSTSFEFCLCLSILGCLRMAFFVALFVSFDPKVCKIWRGDDFPEKTTLSNGYAKLSVQHRFDGFASRKDLVVLVAPLRFFFTVFKLLPRLLTNTYYPWDHPNLLTSTNAVSKTILTSETHSTLDCPPSSWWINPTHSKKDREKGSNLWEKKRHQSCFVLFHHTKNLIQPFGHM